MVILTLPKWHKLDVLYSPSHHYNQNTVLMLVGSCLQVLSLVQKEKENRVFFSK